MKKCIVAAVLLLVLHFPLFAQQETRTEIPRQTESLSPVVNDFKLLIEGDPELFMLFNEMFEQANQTIAEPGYPERSKQIKNYQELLSYLNQALIKAPEFDMTENAGTPINDALIGVMATPAGATAFLNPKVNQQLKKTLNEWAVFLKSPDSRYVLNDDPMTGWLGVNAMKAMPGFEKDFICDPTAPYYGFTSWDDFFTRRLGEGARPVADPKNDAVIANACESSPYKVATNVQLRDRFWIKKQPYSLIHMLDGDACAEQFIGGTVYQAYLSAFSYHRWHTPVSGRIVKTKLIDGSFYAQAPSVGFDPVGPNESQGYLTEVAARALVLIQADNPDIGLMALLFVGMGDVSSNEITVYEGQHVAKGDQVGMFHFGGSTYCMIFRPGVKLEFDLRGQTPGLKSTNIPVRSKLATVASQGTVAKKRP